MNKKGMKMKHADGEATVRPNIVMEEPLVYAEQKATGIKTKTGVVHYALREVVRRQQMRVALLTRGEAKFSDGHVAELTEA